MNENSAANFCAEFAAWKNENLKQKFQYKSSVVPPGDTVLAYADGTVRSEISQGRIGTKLAAGTPGGTYLYDRYAYDSPLEKANMTAAAEQVIASENPRASICHSDDHWRNVQPGFHVCCRKSGWRKEHKPCDRDKGC